MAIKEELNRRYMAAMRAKESRVADLIRNVRASVQDETKKKGFSGEVDDALFLQMISKYVKQLEKALPDFERAGEAGAPTVERYRFEIDYLTEFLPKKLGEDETRTLVRETISSLGVTDPKQLGRVMGAIMKDHKDAVDAQMVRKLVTEELA